MDDSDDEEVEITDRRRCINSACDIRMSCARFNDEDFKQDAHFFHGGLRDGASCPDFILRAKLGRGNPDLVFTEGRKRGRRHNAHAYTEPRKDYPGSAALFGTKLTEAFRGRKRAHNHRKGGESSLSVDAQLSTLPKRPDLMVSRHIKDGRNINAPAEEGAKSDQEV